MATGKQNDPCRQFEYYGEVLKAFPLSTKSAAAICPNCNQRVHFELVNGQTTHPIFCIACMVREKGNA